MTAQEMEMKTTKTASGWAWLLLAGAFEVGFTTFLKLAQHNESYYAGFLVCAILSFEFLSYALKTVPLSIAYAIWTGIGAVGTVVVGATLFSESLSPVRLLLLFGLIAALIGLKLATPKSKTAA